jgi:hypothetical protein
VTNTKGSQQGLATAKAALLKSVEVLLKGEDYDDLDWLPSDFPDRLMDIAWRHRADLDGSRFRRDLKKYIKGLVPDTGATS